MDNEMNNRIEMNFDRLIDRYPQLASCKDEIYNAYLFMAESYKNGRKLLVAGNGGSAADAEHIVGELMKRFEIPRPLENTFSERLLQIDPLRGRKIQRVLEQPLPAIALVGHEALSTAFANDVDGTYVFSQQILGFGISGDTFIAISTSGNSENILNAVVTAKAMGIKVIGLTGVDGGELKKIADVSVCVPERETFMVQELHLPVYHCWCQMLEAMFFGER